MKTVLDTIHGGTEYLEKRGVEDARLTMQILLAHVLGCQRIELYVDFDRPLEEDQLAPMRDYVKRRGQGEPLQYILGEVEFYGRVFRSDSRALIPRPETEEMVDIVLKRFSPAGDESVKILDMGCGSGVLGLSLVAEIEGSQGTLVDASSDALALARENAQALELDDRVEFVHGDLFSELEEKRFGLVVANLPYIPKGEIPTLSREVQHDPISALDGGADGLDIIRNFVRDLKKHTEAGALVGLEIGENQSVEVIELLQQAGFYEVEAVNDLSGVARFVFAV